MPRKYSNEFKSMIMNIIMNEHASTSVTAGKFDIPLKTLEKWITAYNKDKHCFDPDYQSSTQQIQQLKKKIRELDRNNDILKKTITLLEKEE